MNEPAYLFSCLAAKGHLTALKTYLYRNVIHENTTTVDLKHLRYDFCLTHVTATYITHKHLYFKYFSNHPNITSNRATRRSVRPPRLTPWDSPGSSNSSVSTPNRRRAMNTCSPCSWSQR